MVLVMQENSKSAALLTKQQCKNKYIHRSWRKIRVPMQF